MAALFSVLVILFLPRFLLECRQTSVEQVHGVVRIVDTETSILGDHSPVPESGSLRFGVGSFDFFTFCIKQATGLQSHFKLVKLILDGGLRAVDVQTLRTTVAGLAVLYVRLKGVVVVLTQVAGYAGVAKRVAVSYTHLRAHETDSYLVCRLLLEK